MKELWYADALSEELSTIQLCHEKLEVREGVKSKFCCGSQFPSALKCAVEDELDRIEKMGVMMKANFSE